MEECAAAQDQRCRRAPSKGGSWLAAEEGARGGRISTPGRCRYLNPVCRHCQLLFVTSTPNRGERAASKLCDHVSKTAAIEMNEDNELGHIACGNIATVLRAGPASSTELNMRWSSMAAVWNHLDASTTQR